MRCWNIDTETYRKPVWELISSRDSVAVNLNLVKADNWYAEQRHNYNFSMASHPILVRVVFFICSLYFITSMWIVWHSYNVRIIFLTFLSSRNNKKERIRRRARHTEWKMRKNGYKNAFSGSFVANLTLLIDNELGIQEKLQWNINAKRWSDANQRCRWHCTLFETAAAIWTASARNKNVTKSVCMDVCSVGTGVYLHTEWERSHSQSVLNPHSKTS